MVSSIEKRTYNDWKEYCAQVQSALAVNLTESPAQQQARKNKALHDYNFFVKTYFPVYADVDCAGFHINAANTIVLKKRAAGNPNLIAVLEWPREHAKSVHANIIIPMWLMAHNKLNGMILMGKNEADACNLLADIQAQLQYNALFIYDWGEQYNFGDWQTGDFTTKTGIRFLGIGRDQSPRGARKGQRRPNYAVCDDIDDDELVHNQQRVKKIIKRVLGALYFALDTRGGTLVVAGNRIHAQSVLAHMVGDIKPGAPRRENIYHSKIYAIDPQTGEPAWKERYTIEMINSKLAAAGIYGRTELFHENHIDGDIFKDSMIHYIKMWHLLPKYTVIIGYFDPSFEENTTSDFKAIRVWAGYQTNGNDWQRHCLKSFVRRAPLMDAFEWMSAFDDKLPKGIAVLWYMEKQFITRPIHDALYAHNKNRAKEGKPALVVLTDTRKKENKYVRMVKMQPSYLNHQNFFNIDEMYNPDMVEGNNQLKGLEPGYKTPDDAPDADEAAWHYLDQHQPGRDFKPLIGRDERREW